MFESIGFFLDFKRKQTQAVARIRQGDCAEDSIAMVFPILLPVGWFVQMSDK